ncbi:MAG: PAS/PAC sensor hybrid histidine kinase [uncultured bacterium]|nr:MAG: PAS/PAC sensor hybrid histidine kinase [uncultured bacterium]
MKIIKKGTSGLPFHLRIIKHSLYLLVLMLVIAGFIISGCSQNQTIIPVSGLATLKVVIDNNYPPFSFLDEQGKLQGILIDRWKLWERKTGNKVDITGMDWALAQEQMELGNFDVIDTIFRTESRELIYAFSEPYQDIEVPIYFNNNISGIVDVTSLKGFSVAVKANDAAIDYLNENGITNLVEYNSYEAIIKAAANNQVMVFVMDKPPADYFLEKYKIRRNFNQTLPLYTGQFRRAVLEGNTALLNIIDKGFSRISEEEYLTIDRKWYESTVDAKSFLQVIEIIGGISLVFFLILIIWNRSLQSQVKRKTEVVLESEQKFRQIFETSSMGMSITDSEGRYISGNPAILEMLGYKQDEYSLLTTTNLTHPDEIQKFENFRHELWKESIESFTFEKRTLHKNGHYLWGRVTSSLVSDANGKPQFSIEMFEDITSQKYSEKLRESIYRISQATISSSSLEDLYTSIHKIVGEIMPVENFYIALYDSTTNLLHFPFFNDQYEAEAEPIVPGHGLTDYVMRMGQALLANKDEFEKLLSAGEVELIGAKPFCWLGVPLIVNDVVIGVMASQSYSKEISFSQKDAEFLEFVSNQIAQAIELKRAEEASRQSELRYRYLFEDSPVSIWEEDFSNVKIYLEKQRENGVNDFKKFFEDYPEEIGHCVSLIKVMDVNNQALKLTKANSKSELFKKMDCILDESFARDFLPEILNIAEGKTEFEWEGINNTLDGTPIFVNLRWTVVEGFEKTLSKVIVSMIDVSKSKKAEAELLASEERYRNLVDNLGEGIVIIDQNTRFLFANHSANAIFGFNKGTLEKTKLNDFIKSDSQDFINQQIGTLKAGESNTFELEIVRHDGEHRFVQIFARPQFDAEHIFTGTFGIIHDITERKKSEEKRGARSRFEEMLTNISTRFINVDNEDIDNEIISVLKHIGQFENVDRTYVFRIDPKTKTMSNTHEWCREGITPKICDLQELPIHNYHWFIEQITCDPLIISRVNDLPVSASVEKKIFQQYGIQSLANFPMWVNLELVGFVGFDTVTEEHTWDMENIAMLQQFANIISNAIERSRLLKILEDRAIRDELTGVLNRRGFLQIANTELIRGRRYHHPVGMILLDMDHLKRINDTYGHAAGDIALLEISKFCIKNTREIDAIGRWGGDEFVILLPESDEESTIRAATRLQQSISEQTIQILGQEIQLSISAGVALAEKEITTIDELFKNADSALYLAKEAGRNRIKAYRAFDHTTLTF